MTSEVHLSQPRPILSLPKTKRPREKLSVQGVQNINNAELLAVILGSGIKNHNVLTLARQVLRRFPWQAATSVPAQPDLEQLPGIGPYQSAKIRALFELANRLSATSHQQLITTPTQALQAVHSIAYKQREYVMGLYLNARQELLAREMLAVGGLNANHLEPRDVFSKALRLPCASLILAHNHPSGDPLPSQDDLHFTQVMQAAAELLGIELADHIIVASGGHYSFREQGLL